MTSHNLANILKLLSDILYALPDERIEKSLKTILGSLTKDASARKEVGRRGRYRSKPTERPESEAFEQNLDQVAQSIQQMSADEAQAFMESAAHLKKVASLKELASKLGIAISSRQNRMSLIHTILKHLERGRLDETIRTRTHFVGANELDGERDDK